ncbi:hypothetical protein M406DRAFT_336900 [Cryphonectria parasitica EP155]|uniref:Sodium/calcium exchanger membrane region domain-containing protein n=1 Tax=Cryphonectria parasitica (strain ATCC 38755 / EP155) TaxID=660469 RepID=A0A9P4Y8K3_CRYP1|nr:uncharacterized protein M406DRAFT_336900 [Cryphonectria parasitica EP155]KAF3768404.1 hypothetical protein M406DRAFT_336900 [Cryphonectria parasitica EP155]
MGTYEVLFNVAAFLAGLSLFKLFVSSATMLAKRLHIPEMLVAILIAGAEWEELTVVALSLAQRRPALAVGNTIGSCVANIFGAFALGLVFSTGAWEGFDRSSKTACVALLALTSVVSLFSLADILWNRVVAGLLLVAFVAYMVLHGASSFSSSSKLRKFHHTLIPILKLVCGFVVLTVSGFILSHIPTHLAASFDMSDAAFGATVLSLATSLPEKFLAVMSSTRGHTGLLIADAVGSNVFLLTLCLGIAAWSFVSVSRIEACWLWAAAVALTVVVAIGGKAICKVAGVRQMLGALMLVAYGGFLEVEFTILQG